MTFAVQWHTYKTSGNSFATLKANDGGYDIIVSVFFIKSGGYNFQFCRRGYPDAWGPGGFPNWQSAADAAIKALR